MDRLVKCALFFLLLTVAAGFAEDEVQKKQSSVLVVYSSGTPVPGFTDSTLSLETLEAVSSATPVLDNTAQAARIISKTLEAEGLQVRMARAEDFEKKDWREVNGYDYIVLGSPAHFWQMSWEMKKFFDEVFHMIYSSEKQARGKSFALFSVGAGLPGTEGTIANMEQAVGINDGAVVSRLALTKGMSSDDFSLKAVEFARSFAILAKK